MKAKEFMLQSICSVERLESNARRGVQVGSEAFLEDWAAVAETGGPPDEIITFVILL